MAFLRTPHFGRISVHIRTGALVPVPPDETCRNIYPDDPLPMGGVRHGASPSDGADHNSQCGRQPNGSHQLCREGTMTHSVSDTRLEGAADRKRHEEIAQHFAAMVASSDDAIISKNLDGVITSWNPGATRIFGYEAAEVIGKPVTLLIPPAHLDEEPRILERIRRGDRVEHYETIRRRKDGSLIDISLSVSPIRDAQGVIIGASKVARDITERKATERRLERQTLLFERLNRVAKIIARDLDLDRTVQAVTDIATELSGAKFGAFFYNVLDAEGESYMLYTLSGAPRSAFENFGMPRNTAVFDPTFKGTEVVRSADIRSDPRYGKNEPHFGMPKGHLPVVSYLAVPVIGRSGDVLGGLFFGHDEPGVFGEEAEHLVIGIAGHAAVALDNARLHKAVQEELAQRRRAEEAKELLLHEIQHRVKNTLGTVLAIAGQTFRTAPQEARAAFASRIQALAGAHSLLTQNDWSQADLRAVIQQSLEPFRDDGRERFTFSGPAIKLEAGQSLTLAMIFHELSTNAVKYGALSNDTGRVDVVWDIREGPGGPLVHLEWRESGGPQVTPPARKGFGSTLIERALDRGRGKAHVEYAAAGVVCVMEIRLQPR
jgi:PAS domain S-box-containing protein